MALCCSDLQLPSVCVCVCVCVCLCVCLCVCVCVLQRIRHRWVWLRRHGGCSQGRVRRTKVTKMRWFWTERHTVAVGSWPWGGLSCRGQSAAAQDCRHHSGQRAHLHRWWCRNADMLPIGTGGLLCSEGFCASHTLSLLSGKRVGGQAALEMGLVNRAVEQNQTGDAAYREALSLAREILPQVRIHARMHSRVSMTSEDIDLNWFPGHLL